MRIRTKALFSSSTVLHFYSICSVQLQGCHNSLSLYLAVTRVECTQVQPEQLTLASLNSHKSKLPQKVPSLQKLPAASIITTLNCS